MLVCFFAGVQNPFGPNHREFHGLELCVEFLLAMLYAVSSNASCPRMSPSAAVHSAFCVDNFCSFRLRVTDVCLLRCVQAPDQVVSIENKSVTVHRDTDTDQAFLTYKMAIFQTKLTNVVDKEPVVVSAAVQDTDSLDLTDSERSSMCSDKSDLSSCVDSVATQFSSFKLEPIRGPIASTYNTGKYVFYINPDLKITKIWCQFRITSEKPAFI